MQRKAYVTGVALLVALTAGCSSGSGGGGPSGDSKAGVPKAAAAQPGRYRTLPEPCRAVNKGVLKDMLPGAAELPDDQKAKAYEGVAELTYDTDRRVGCRWKDEAPDGVRRLYVDFERVVSYAPAVSDDDQAKAVYGKKQTAAKLPAPTDGDKGGAHTGGAGKGTTGPGGSPSPTPSPKSSGLNALSGAASPAASAPVSPPASGGPAGPPDGLQPRVLSGLGDAAFLNDVLVTSGSAVQRRTVTVVFRTSNVIVTVEYTEQPTSPNALAPDSQELQEKSRALAAKLVEIFGE
ncbi:DUF3558 domain-containing protein [Streptomyces sp. CBMA152]|uniref:DUF3558 domain-containing protein n=1 Tax=Streptomyces sp. CBMA152 TaxID=1896312 RepID=UPI00166156CE|nr:DUF3558 domain-containing protein [Streptomyces sp. CBMA152]MBD0745758.1 hypothetical protein [Streptomyces sp. CBMA152]